MWTEERDEALINVVSLYPWVYDAAHEGYKDVAMRRNAWKDISTQLSVDGMLHYLVNLVLEACYTVVN